MTEAIDRCSGHCCENFFLPFEPQELADRGRLSHPDDVEIRKIADMAIYLGPDSAGSNRYTCVHYDGAGNCMDYENRPTMCREFPYGLACPFDGCTWKSAEEETLVHLRLPVVGQAVSE